MLPILAVAVIAVVMAEPSSATFPGKNGRISFSRFVPKTNSVEIFTARPNGRDLRKLTRNPRSASLVPDWSPDGRRIAFHSDRRNIEGRRNIQIYVMNADGSGVTQLTRGRGFHGVPAWSPDATSIAIETDWGGGRPLQGIWIIPASDPDGVTREEAQRVTRMPAGLRYRPLRRGDSEPQFSPDGTAIVFTRFRRDRRSAIHRVNVNGTGLRRLTRWRLNASDPDWSPNGRRITFDSGNFGASGSKGDIWVMRANGRRKRRLTNVPRLRRGARYKLANNPVWSPNGRRIMYTLLLPRRTVLVRMRANGSRKRVVVRRGFNNRVDWGRRP